jgi:ABC-type Fe2+-enterobactin transport system substrate-binding protein
MTDDDAFKALADKVGHMDGRLNMAEKDISRFDRTHELTPHRLTLLEQQYENLTRQLASIGTMLSSISEKQWGERSLMAWALLLLCYSCSISSCRQSPR